MKPRLLSAGVLLACVLTAPAAGADDLRRAAELFHAGEEAYARRQFREAAAMFEEANRCAPRAGALYAAAVSWEEAGEPARAADELELALATQQHGADLDPNGRQDARVRLSRLAARLAVVELDGPTGAIVTVAHASRVVLPARVHLAPGSWTIRREDLAGAPPVAIFVSAGETKHVTMLDRPPPETERRTSPLRTVGWVSLGAAGVFAASAAVLGLATLSARDEFVDSGSTDASARDRAITFRTMTNVAWAGAAVAAACAIPILVFSPRASAGGAQVAVGAGDLRATFAF